MHNQKHTEETKRKISLAKMGSKGFWLGKKRDDTTKKKISFTLKSKNLSGDKSSTYKNGKPKCKICNKQLSGYKSKHCNIHAKEVLFRDNPEIRLKISESHKGEKSYRWIKDRTKLIGRHNRDFHDPEYKQWVLKVRNRDSWKCKISNDNCSGRLETHHILGWKSHPELRYEVNNGITLCHFHHPRKRNDEIRLSPYFMDLIKM